MRRGIDAQVDLEAQRDPGAAVDQRNIAFARLDPEDDVRERRRPPRVGAGADHLAHGQLAQRCQVFGAKEVGQRAFDAIGRIDFSGPQPFAQRLRGRVDEDDVAGQFQDCIGKRLADAPAVRDQRR